MTAASEATVLTVAALTAADVEQVYSGTDGRCCCGCSGTHYTDGRAYDRMVAKVLKLMKANAESVEENSSTCFSIVVGARLYVLYLNGHHGV